MAREYRPKKRRSKLRWILAGIACFVGFGALIAGPIMSRVEHPEYKVASSAGSIEIRQYGPMIAAQATVSGKRDLAINEGFRIIAAYIFGANKPNTDIKMTAPVQQQRKQQISMTAPVTQQGHRDAWTVRFIMPKRWTMETLPLPEDSRIKLRPIPAQRMLAIRFSGTASDEVIDSKTIELRAHALASNIAISGAPVYAFYNPPWTLPFFRRNEIMYKIAGS